MNGQQNICRPAQMLKNVKQPLLLEIKLSKQWSKMMISTNDLSMILKDELLTTYASHEFVSKFLAVKSTLWTIHFCLLNLI